MESEQFSRVKKLQVLDFVDRMAGEQEVQDFLQSCLVDAAATHPSVEIATRKRKSFQVKDPEQAKRLVDALNEAARVPEISYQVGVAYLSMQDPQMAQRTWEQVFVEYVEWTVLVSRKGKGSSTHERIKNAVKDRAFDLIRTKKLLSTTSQDLLNVLKRGGVATNVYLRRIHALLSVLTTWARPEVSRRIRLGASSARRNFAEQRR